MKINFIIEHAVDVPLSEEALEKLIGKPLKDISTIEDYRKIEGKASFVDERLLAFKVVEDLVN